MEENKKNKFDEIILLKKARRRFVGSLILVISAILFLPLIIENKTYEKKNISYIVPEMSDGSKIKENISSAKKEYEKKQQEIKLSNNSSFFVQLGAFSNHDNAKELIKKLVEKKYRPESEIIKTLEGEKLRVRLGPFQNINEANKIAKVVKNDFDNIEIIIDSNQ